MRHWKTRFCGRAKSREKLGKVGTSPAIRRRAHPIHTDNQQLGKTTKRERGEAQDRGKSAARAEAPVHLPRRRSGALRLANPKVGERGRDPREPRRRPNTRTLGRRRAGRIHAARGLARPARTPPSWDWASVLGGLGGPPLVARLRRSMKRSFVGPLAPSQGPGPESRNRIFFLEPCEKNPIPGSAGRSGGASGTRPPLRARPPVPGLHSQRCVPLAQSRYPLLSGGRVAAPATALLALSPFLAEGGEPGGHPRPPAPGAGASWRRVTLGKVGRAPGESPAIRQ